jgi:hypothetical protein
MEDEVREDPAMGTSWNPKMVEAKRNIILQHNFQSAIPGYGFFYRKKARKSSGTQKR